jgi:hypothetical protein
MLKIQPVLNDVNPQDLETLGLIIQRYPINGSILIDPLDPHGFIYHPPENGTFSGTTSFEFALTDGTDISQTYTASIVVNNAPQFAEIPDFIECDRSATLTLPILVSDADTPANQLVFSLQNAPSWLSIENQNDYTAIISGTPQISGLLYQVCTVNAYDPLSQTTSRVTLLLTFDPNATGFILTVINGSGGGLFDTGVRAQITARDSNGQDGFLGWVGDIDYLDDHQSATPTVEIPDHDLTLTAVFVSLQATSYSDWADSAGVTGDSPTDTPANDDLTNLEKYATGLSPNQAYDPSALFTYRLDQTAETNHFIIQYQKSKQASDAEITPTWSASLTAPNWRSDLIKKTLIDETDTLNFWEATLPIETNEQSYLRLHFQLQE